MIKTNFSVEELVQDIINENFNNDVNDYILKENQFRISSIAYCSRRIYYDKTIADQAKERDQSQKRAILLGNLIHAFLENHFKSQHFVVEKELAYPYKDIELIGHPDIILPDRVVDIKVTNENSFLHRLEDEHPNSYHYFQVNCYACIEDFPIASILYVNTNNFDFCERALAITRHYFDACLEKVLSIYKQIQEKTLPEYDNENWECRFCSYQINCQKEDSK